MELITVLPAAAVQFGIKNKNPGSPKPVTRLTREALGQQKLGMKVNLN